MLTRMPVVGDYVQYKRNGKVNKVISLENRIVFIDDRLSSPGKTPIEYNCFIGMFGQDVITYNNMFTIVDAPTE